MLFQAVIFFNVLAYFNFFLLIRCSEKKQFGSETGSGFRFLAGSGSNEYESGTLVATQPVVCDGVATLDGAS